MKTILITAALAAVAALSSPAQGRETVSLNMGWDFHPGSPDAPAQRVDLPHDFLINQPWVAPGADEKADLANGVANVKSRLSARGFKEMGTGWYVKDLRPLPSWRGKRIVLDFEGIMLVGDVWLGGKKIASTDYGYLGMEADVTDLIDWDGPNEIRVFADTRGPANSRWYTGAGLYRDVNLIVTDKRLHFERHPLKITTHGIVPGKEARVALQADVWSAIPKKTPVTARIEITGPGHEGTVATADIQLKTSKGAREYPLDTLTVAAPRLWSCDDPALYTATVTLLDPQGNECDRVSQRFGIRTIEYTPSQGLLLNGSKVLLKGIANHHTLGALGAAAYPDAMRRRMAMLKEWGFNHVRTSHNPYSESFLDLCDELGILVVDELYDKWLTQYAGGRRDWMELWLKDVPEWVKRDRNHPSVVMWSLGNELQTLYDIPYHDYGVTPYRMQKGLLQRYDTTRPVTVAMHPRGRNHKTDSLPADLALVTDIAAYNYRYMYFPGDSRRFPHMIFYQSEASTSRLGANWHGMDLDRVTGLAYWGAIDYLGESQGWPVKGWDKGVFDISLQPKPQAWLVKSYFKPDEPLVHIAVKEGDNNVMWNDVLVGTDLVSDHWNYRPGSVLGLYTYTNAHEVELVVCGKSMGRKPNVTADPEQRNMIYWDSIPYKAGWAEAIAYDAEGRVTARHRVETAGKPVRLVASIDEGASPMGTDPCALRHITVKAVDSHGRTVPSARQMLTFDVAGGGSLAGVVNGDLTSGELFSGPTRSLYRGKAAAIVRGDGSGQPVKVRITAPGLKGTAVSL